jgi:general secretion pathway protein G
MRSNNHLPRRRRALSYLELLAVVTLVGILAAVAIVRLSGAATSRKSACYTLKGNIEVQAQLWRRNKGVWPAANLADMAADKAYLPEGLPACPVDNSAYTFDSVSQRVTGHVH